MGKLVEKCVDSSWAHMEVVNEGGWFKNLLHGKEPWIEVAFLNRQSLQLNLGVPKSQQESIPTVPWPQDGKKLWTVPVKEIPELIEWIDKCLVAVSDNSQYKLSGWIDGL